MPDAMERVLQLVADGRLTAEEAEPLLAALDRDPAGNDERGRDDRNAPPRAAVNEPRPERAGRFVRVEVTERGIKTVNLRLPASLGSHALMAVPGLGGSTFERVRAALAAGVVGPIVEVADEDGDGVRIVID